MIVLTAIAAWAQESSEIVCNDLPAGAPTGAEAVAASSLPWVNEVRSKVAAGDAVELDADEVEAWLEVDLPYTDVFGARSQTIDGELIVELRAPARPSVVPVNVVAVVDVSRSMSSVPTRSLPLLQDAPSTHRYRAVSRLELAREALWDLIEHLPPGSRLGILAYDGRRARVVLPPGDDTLRMGVDVGQLTEGVISPFDEHLPVALNQISTDTFRPCETNRVFILTDDANDMGTEMLFGNVDRWAVGDLERWTFAVGDFDAIDVQRSLLEDGPRTARWVINGASDARTLWPLLLDAGGVSARQVVLRTKRDTFELGDLTSGESLVVRMPARRGKQLELTVDGEPVPIEAGEPGPSALARVGQAGSVGQGAELAAFERSREPDVDPRLLAVSGWRESGAVVVELWKDPEHAIDASELTVQAPGRAPVRATAWGTDGNRVLVVAQVEDAPEQVRVTGQGLPDESWVRLRSRRVGLDWIEGAQALRDDQDWTPRSAVIDPRLSSLLTQAAVRANDDEAVLRWTQGCLDVIAPDLLESCVAERVAVLLRRDELAESLALLDEALERVPGSARLALLDADIASDHQEWTVAEERYLQALESAPFEARASRGLALVMQEQNLPSLAALAWTRHLLFHPSDERARLELLDLLTSDAWRLGTQRGPLSEVDKLATRKRLYQMKLLFEDWSQAQRKGRTKEEWQDDPWYRLVGPMFSKLDHDGYVRFAAIRVLVHPDQLADHVSEGVGEVGLMLGMRR